MTIPLRDAVHALDGVFLAGAGPEPRGGAVVAAPHPLMGGSMDSPVVNQIADACHRAGVASLRFDWRGVGASAGTPSGELEAADEDYSAAARYLEETVEGPLLAAGYSFGAGAALRAAGRRPRLRRLLLVSPPVAMLDRQALADLARGALLVTGEHDAWSPASELLEIADTIAGVSLRVIPQADHFYAAGLSELGRVIRNWL